MFKKLSLKTQIFFLVTLVVVVAFVAVSAIVFTKTAQMAEQDAFRLAYETAERYKNEITTELQGARITAETLATVFETLKENGLTDRDMMNDILQAALKQKSYLNAFCVAYDPNALDGQDEKYAGHAPEYDSTGRFSPYWSRLNGRIQVEPLHEIDSADWYVIPKETGHEYITDPYPYQIQGSPVMLASLVFPIIYQNNTIGIVASDIVLDTLQEMVSRANPRGQGGQTQIISNAGVIVAHPKKQYLGGDLAGWLLRRTLLGHPNLARDVVRFLEQESERATPEQEEGIANLLQALKAQLENSNSEALSLALFTPELTQKIMASDQNRWHFVSEILDAVRKGNDFVDQGDLFYTVYLPVRFSDVTEPWSVAVSIPMTEVLKNAHRIRNYVVGVSFIAVCAIAVILYLIAGRVARPILMLASAAESIAGGNFKAEIPAAQGANELVTLTDAFRCMAEKNEELIGAMQRYAAELEEKNKYLNRLNELKDEFLANTSHELRTPLNGIIGIAESMVDGATGPLSKQQKYNLTLISGSGKRLSNMVNDILDFTKLKNNEITLRSKAVDLKTIVETILALSAPMVQGKELQLVCEISDTFPLVEADENRIQQILYNLIGNAIKFTEEGRVTVFAEAKDGVAQISVLDTGIGISEDKFGLIFESFEQADGSTEREYGGTGLGLAITKKLIELHGGTVEVSSTPGKGSVFTFSLPLASADMERPLLTEEMDTLVDFEEPLPEESPEDFDRMVSGGDILYRILVVDDEPINVQVLKNLLRTGNCSITCTYSGIEALELIESGESFDLILLDIMMPKMSGYDVCRRLRRQYSLFELPVLMLTAKNQIQDIVLGFQAGANDYLSKPFDKTELRARVQTLLSLRQAVKTSIETEILFENEKQKRLLEQTLLELTNALTETIDLKDVLVKVMDTMSHFISFKKSLMLLKEEDEFTVGVADGMEEGILVAGEVVDIAQDPFFKKITETLKPVSSDELPCTLLKRDGEDELLVGVPIVYRDTLLGIIGLVCPKGDISRDLLFSLAGQAGIAIQNARMFTKINIMATTDGLTGLYNRRYFFELVEKEFAKYKRYGHPLSVCMVDIDYFKKVNDNYGHAIGDEVLRHLAKNLKELLREYDVVGRYGGEEFAVLFPETPLEVALKVAERIRSTIESAAVPTDEFGDIRYTLSIGVSTFSKEIKTIACVFEEADKALYEAKKSGRNKVVAMENLS